MHKKSKVIYITMSSTLILNKEKPNYVYNRIITYEDISFGTGIPCMFSRDNKELQKFIKKHKYSKCSHFSRCLWLYVISKNDKRLKQGIIDILEI